MQGGVRVDDLYEFGGAARVGTGSLFLLDAKSVDVVGEPKPETTARQAETKIEQANESQRKCARGWQTKRCALDKG